MALIYCPDCGKQVSDLAHACPNCGYPIKTGLDSFINNKAEDENDGPIKYQSMEKSFSNQRQEFTKSVYSEEIPNTNNYRSNGIIKYWIAIGVLIVTSIVSVAYGIITYSSAERQKSDLRGTISEIYSRNGELEKRNQELAEEEEAETAKFNSLMKEYFTYKRYY